MDKNCEYISCTKIKEVSCTFTITGTKVLDLFNVYKINCNTQFKNLGKIISPTELKYY